MPTDDELNIDICKWIGWSYDASTDFWRKSKPDGHDFLIHGDKGKPTYLPDHIDGIKALGNMHAAEENLTPDQQADYSWYLNSLHPTATLDACQDDKSWRWEAFKLIHATARQRAIALLMVVRPEVFQ